MGTGPLHHGTFPIAVGELVVAAMASEAENLEHVLAGTAVARRRLRGDDVQGFVSDPDGGHRFGAEAAALIDPALGVNPRSGENRLVRVIAELDFQFGHLGQLPSSVSCFQESIPDI